MTFHVGLQIGKVREIQRAFSTGEAIFGRLSIGMNWEEVCLHLSDVREDVLAEWASVQATALLMKLTMGMKVGYVREGLCAVGTA